MDSVVESPPKNEKKLGQLAVPSEVSPRVRFADPDNSAIPDSRLCPILCPPPNPTECYPLFPGCRDSRRKCLIPCNLYPVGTLGDYG